jgi:hypothetical protein
MFVHAERGLHALSADVRKTRSGPAPVNSTSPLPYKSKSGPTLSDGSAMYPSNDIDAPVMTSPVAIPSVIRSPRAACRDSVLRGSGVFTSNNARSAALAPRLGDRDTQRHHSALRGKPLTSRPSPT